VEAQISANAREPEVLAGDKNPCSLFSTGLGLAG